MATIVTERHGKSVGAGDTESEKMAGGDGQTEEGQAGRGEVEAAASDVEMET